MSSRRVDGAPAAVELRSMRDISAERDLRAAQELERAYLSTDAIARRYEVALTPAGDVARTDRAALRGIQAQATRFARMDAPALREYVVHEEATPIQQSAARILGSVFLIAQRKGVKFSTEEGRAELARILDQELPQFGTSPVLQRAIQQEFIRQLGHAFARTECMVEDPHVFTEAELEEIASSLAEHIDGEANAETAAAFVRAFRAGIAHSPRYQETAVTRLDSLRVQIHNLERPMGLKTAWDKKRAKAEKELLTTQMRLNDIDNRRWEAYETHNRVNAHYNSLLERQEEPEVARELEALAQQLGVLRAEYTALEEAYETVKEEIKDKDVAYQQAVSLNLFVNDLQAYRREHSDTISALRAQYRELRSAMVLSDCPRLTAAAERQEELLIQPLSRTTIPKIRTGEEMRATLNLAARTGSIHLLISTLEEMETLEASHGHSEYEIFLLELANKLKEMGLADLAEAEEPADKTLIVSRIINERMLAEGPRADTTRTVMTAVASLASH